MTEQMDNLQSIFVQVIRKPNRKVIIKRGIKAYEVIETVMGTEKENQ